MRRAHEWRADHFGGSGEDDDSPVVEGDIANPDIENEAGDSEDDSTSPSTDTTASTETTTADPADGTGAFGFSRRSILSVGRRASLRSRVTVDSAAAITDET